MIDNIFVTYNRHKPIIHKFTGGVNNFQAIQKTLADMASICFVELHGLQDG